MIPADNPLRGSFTEQDILGKMPVPEEINPLGDREYFTFAHSEGKRGRQEVLYDCLHALQEAFVIVKQYEVITVTDIIAGSPCVFQILIQFIHVEIAEPLARVVADRRVFVAFNTVDDIFQQPQGIRAFNLFTDYVREHIVINGRVEL